MKGVHFSFIGSLFVIIVQCLVINANAESPDLYSPVDDVIRLNTHNFNSTLFQQNKNVTYMVQFYNTFCGHCQQFSPIYKELATRFKNCSDLIGIAGIDCSKDENILTCTENKIEGYPSIFLYPPNANPDRDEDKPLNLRSMPIEWNLDGLEEVLIDYVANLTTSNREHALVSEALWPVTVNRMEKFERLYSPDMSHDDTIGEAKGHQDLMLIVESSESYLGRRLILDYYKIHSKLELRRVLIDNRELLESLLSRDDYMKLKDIEPLLLQVVEQRIGYNAQILVKGELKHILPSGEGHERRDYILKRFKTFLDHFYAAELENNLDQIKLQTHTTNVTSKKIKSNDDRLETELKIKYLLDIEPTVQKKMFATDLLKGIVYILTHELPVKGNLNRKDFNTIRNLLTILKKYLPLDKWDSSLSEFVVDLRTRLDQKRTIYENNGISAQEMRDQLELAGSEDLKTHYKNETWVSCLASDKHNKGYTCSLWLLFHTLTVGEFMKTAPVNQRPKLVLHTMRDYIINFLGCTVCSANFEKETENLESSLNYRNSSILWLWNTHNLVNERLNNEKSSSIRKSLSEVLFPTHKYCPQCMKTNVNEIGVDGKTLQDIDWNMDKVFDHMLAVYAPEKIITPSEFLRLMSKRDNKVNYDLIDNELHKGLLQPSHSAAEMNRSVEQWNIFSTSDMGLCIFLYLFCIMIVAVVCMSLNPKWRRLKIK